MPSVAVNPQVSGVNQPINQNKVQKAVFSCNGRPYVCSKTNQELRIKNDRGDVLAVSKGDPIGLIGKSRNEARKVNVTKPPYYNLIKTALKAIEEGK